MKAEKRGALTTEGLTEVVGFFRAFGTKGARLLANRVSDKLGHDVADDMASKTPFRPIVRHGRTKRWPISRTNVRFSGTEWHGIFYWGAVPHWIGAGSGDRGRSNPAAPTASKWRARRTRTRLARDAMTVRMQGEVQFAKNVWHPGIAVGYKGEDAARVCDGLVDRYAADELEAVLEEYF